MLRNWRRRSLLVFGVVVIVLVVALFLLQRGDVPDAGTKMSAAPKPVGAQNELASRDRELDLKRPDAAQHRSIAAGGIASLASLDTDFPIVAPLNRPDSTIKRDLEVMAQVFDAWRSNFPRQGNPVGENANITSALVGDNDLGLVLIPRNHPAINPAGELCDRWGMPFRFHQLSGEHMEIRSAGPDRVFGTADDVEWNPLP